MCVSSNARSEAVAIGLARCIDADVDSMLTDPHAVITLATVEAEASAPSPGAFFAGPSRSLLWRGTLQSNSGEAEPYSQTAPPNPKARPSPKSMSGCLSMLSLCILGADVLWKS